MGTRTTIKSKLLATTALLAGLMLSACNVNAVDFETARVKVNDLTLHVEYAQTFDQRAQGLMFRKTLCDDCGMLFVFRPEKQASMWMKNTFIPLDVAFIDRNGVITDIKPLQPHDLTSVGASKVIKYALEMNQGWFAKHDIHVGDQLIVNP
ncbi:DUF192 domain-containing protein [Alteromonas lipolytica]|uniref:DUF192 domain-containing protein n=1 Tax=Alteromonas lipolytica TaxID=1856405 RepID=A0A1E8FCU5_9ALTE|nr:hypothetical protein BFC17_19430 [Alteromonas lipolytica]GGF68735.1 hypothetical protein GCM10011338_21190 [Alteromonas lipolytica]